MLSFIGFTGLCSDAVGVGGNMISGAIGSLMGPSELGTVSAGSAGRRREDGGESSSTGSIRCAVIDRTGRSSSTTVPLDERSSEPWRRALKIAGPSFAKRLPKSFFLFTDGGGSGCW